MAYFDIAANSITAQPVTAYLQGRAMRMAYEGEKQAQQFQQMQMQDWQKQRDFDRQAKATELEQKQKEFDQKQLQGQAAALAGIIRQAGNNPDAVAGLRDLTTATGGKFTFDPNQDPKEQQDTLYAKAAEIEMMAGLTPHEVKWGEDERIVGDERLTYRTRDGVAQGEPIARAPRYKPASTNVTINGQPGNEKFSDKAGELAATRLDDYRQQADDAVQTLTTLEASSTMLDKGMITGFAGDWRLNMARALNLVGADNTETIANTEAFVANQGNEVGRIIKLFGSGTGLSDADREYATKIAAGSIPMNQQSMRKIMNIREKQARWTIKNYANERGRVKDKPGIEFYPEIAEPPAFGGQVAEKTATNPQTGEVMAFRDGKWVKK